MYSGEPAGSSSGFTRLNSATGGTTPVFTTNMALIRDARPEAASRCPMLALRAPTAIWPGRAPIPWNAAEAADHSIGSPTRVPVACASR
jgi:hypothetical protein